MSRGRGLFGFAGTAVWLCLALAPAAAQEAAAPERDSAAPPEGAPQLFDLVGPVNLNDRYLGDIEMRVSASGEGGELDVERLASLLQPLISEPAYQELAALAAQGRMAGFDAASVGGLVVTYDSATLGVGVSLPASARVRNTIRLSGQEAPVPDRFADPGDVVAGVQLLGRKTFSYAGEPFSDQAAARAEGFLTIGGFDGYTISSALDYLPGTDNSFELDGVTLTRDFFDSALRLQAGSVLPQPVGFQSSLPITGIGVSRRYQDIRPFQNIRQTGRESLLLERPSTVDVYVNGLLTNSLTLAPGPYDLDELALAWGSNDVQLVVRDGAGQESVIERSVFYSPILLGPGISDFGAWFGWPEHGRQVRGDRSPVASAYYMQGVGRQTIGANFQASETGFQLGGNIVRAFGTSFIAFDAAWGRKTDRGSGSGTAFGVDAQGNFSVNEADDLRISARAEIRSRDFYSALDDAFSNPFKFQASATASYRADRRTTFSVGGNYSRMRRDSAQIWGINLGVLRQVGRVNVTAYALHEQRRDGRRESSLRFGLSIPLSGSANVTARAETRDHNVEVTANRFRRSLGPDWTGRVTLSRNDDGEAALGQIQWYGQRAFLGARHASTFPRGQDDANRTTVEASTFIGFSDGMVGWGREGFDGFSLVRVHPSLADADVRVQQYGQDVFRADGLGPVALPVPRGYSPVAQDYILQDVPEGYSVSDTARTLFPGFKSGYDFMVGSDAYLSAQGVLTEPSGEAAGLLIGKLVPENASLPDVDFFTASDGRFFAQGLARGEYAVVIGGQRRGTVSVRPSEGLLVDLGEVTIDGE